MKTEDELIKMPYSDRLEYAPYSIWIPTEMTDEEYRMYGGRIETSHHTAISYNKKGQQIYVSSTSCCNGTREEAKISKSSIIVNKKQS